MSLPRAFSGETYKTSVTSCKLPLRALRTKWSIHAKKAARVLPDPVGAQIKTDLSSRMCGQPCSWGSVAEPNFDKNQVFTRGCAHSKTSRSALGKFVGFST